jgi:hypothetical protein
MFASRLLPLVAAVPLAAANLELRYSALERMIGDQMFTQDGKRYVKGDAKAKCQYAYLESPKLGSEPGMEPRLRVTARFSGRSALDLFGKCVGLGDSFDLNLTARPVARDGAIGLQDVKVTSAKDSYYIRRVRLALQQSFQKDFKIEVKDQARKLLAQPSTRYIPELNDFQVQGVRVTQDSLVLAVDFQLVVK